MYFNISPAIMFHANQYGFRAEYSTELALSELVDRIYTDLDEKQLPIAIFIYRFIKSF